MEGPQHDNNNENFLLELLSQDCNLWDAHPFSTPSTSSSSSSSTSSSSTSASSSSTISQIRVVPTIPVDPAFPHPASIMTTGVQGITIVDDNDSATNPCNHATNLICYEPPRHQLTSD